MHLPSKAISQIGKIIEQRADKTGPRLFEGLSTLAVKAIQNQGQKPSIAGTKFEQQLSQKFGLAANSILPPKAQKPEPKKNVLGL
jgi:hypothetical protein